MVFVVAVFKVDAKEITCESDHSDLLWFSYLGPQKNCVMMIETAIDDPNALITAENDDKMAGIVFHGNKKIFFLPINAYEKFPKLLGYDALACSLTEISKQNFRGLNDLKVLRLSYNNINKIAADTFSDLVSLEVLKLSMK